MVPASQCPQSNGDNAQTLGFSVNLDSGRGLLTTRHRRIGPLVVDTLSLEIPHLAFPFDISGGAALFKNRRCALVQLAMHVDAEDLTACLSEHALQAHGFTRLSASVQDGAILLAGHFTHHDHAADFTCRIAPLVQSGREVHLIFYDTRIYGFLPLPGAYLTRFLWRALRWPAWFTELTSAWRLRPVDAFARELLPRGGWKIPTLQQLHQLEVVAQKGMLTAACGEAEPSDTAGNDIPKDALIATDGIALNAAAEAALHDGRIEEAYQRLRRAVDDGQGGGWAASRLLHLGAALPQFAPDTRAYAQRFLEDGTFLVPARLALGALAVHNGNQAAAAVHFAALGQLAQESSHARDAAAAWLAQSCLQADIDVDSARRAGHAAVGLLPREPAGHAHMYRLHRRANDLDQAAQAAERWAQHCDKGPEAAPMFCELGAFFCGPMEDFARARRMYEHALTRVPEFPPALQGLAELHLVRGDTSQAVAFFARLATHWEQAGALGQAVACHMRLAEIWHHRLGDAESAAARYKRVVELDPACLQAVTTLADMAHVAGRTDEALAHYQTVIAADVAGPDAAPAQAVHAYEQAVKILQQTAREEHHVALELAYLDRLILLRPDHQEVRAMRLGFLRAQKLYDRLAQALMEQARRTEDARTACDLLLEAAQLARDELQDQVLLRRLLEAACSLRPDHAGALAMLTPILHGAAAWEALCHVLQAAAGATDDGAVRAGHLVALAETQRLLGVPTSEQAATLRQALQARPDDLPAALALVATLETDPASDAAQTAAACEILANNLTDPQDQAAAWVACARHAGRCDGARAVAAARRAVALQPQSVTAHVALVEALEAAGQATELCRSFAAAAQALRCPAELAEIWSRQARWAQNTRETTLQLQALQGLADTSRLTPAQATDFVTALQGTGQTDRAVVWLEQWADAGAPINPSDALLLAADMLQSALEHARAKALLERVLRHATPYAWRAALSLEQLAHATHQQTWLVEAWHAQIATAPDAATRARKQARLLTWQTDNRDADRLETARALLKTQPCHPLACHVLACHYDMEKAWSAGLDVRLAMLGAPIERGESERRRAAYAQAASVAADLRPALVEKLQAGFASEFPDAKLACEPLSVRLTVQEHWADLLALRREQHRRDPENLGWQREIATLLQKHFARPEEARNMWRAICAAEPNDVPSHTRWLECAELTGDCAASAAARAALARLEGDGAQAWQHALQAAALYTGTLSDPAAARTLLQGCLGALPPPQDETLLIEALTGLGMHAAVLELAPANWLKIRNCAAWTRRIEQALQGLGRHFDYVAFVLHQLPLGTYDDSGATALLTRVMAQCPTAKLLPQQELLARAHAFCARRLEKEQPEAALEHCRSAQRLQPEADADLIDLQEKLLVATDRASEAAALRLSRARRANLGAEARRHFEALADLCAQHLADPDGARRALEQAVRHAPRDTALLRRLLAMTPLPQERATYVATAEALLAVCPEARQDTALLQRLAGACADIDRPRALNLLRAAMAVAPNDADIRARWEAFGGSAADAAAAAPAASGARVAATAVPAGTAAAPAANTGRAMPGPLAALAQQHAAGRPDTDADPKDPVLANIRAWEAAVAREPDNIAYRERYAAACAQSRAHLHDARAAYLTLLQHDCTHTPWLRVLARLEGALNDNAAAYAFYAALLAVQPADPEAQRFVQACRQLRPALPARPFTNMDWSRVRGEFDPASAAETRETAAQPRIEPRAAGSLAPDDAKIAPLAALLSYVGIPLPPLRLWPAGGRQCAVATGDAESREKALMVGTALYNDMPNRAGVFLGLRAILQAHDPGVHPAHGNNASILLAADVAEGIEALCAAEGMATAKHASRATLIKRTPELLDLLRFSQSPTYLHLRREL